MASLTFISGPLQGRTIQLPGGTVHFGRDPAATVSLDDPSVSGHHAKLEVAPNGDWWLSDLGSANGTLVNNQDITRSQVHSGDVIEIGDSRMTFHSAPAAAHVPAPDLPRTTSAPPPPSRLPVPEPVVHRPSPPPAILSTPQAAPVPASPPPAPMPAVPPPEPVRAPAPPRPPAPPPPQASAEDVRLVGEMKTYTENIRREVAKVIIGQTDVLDEILMAMIAGGHALLVGMPGMAKTMMVRTISQVLDLDFKRIQFTPDLMPTDITGTEVLETNRTTQEKEFRFIRGPLFCNMLLADEINRTPPKTQAALLEAMQEKRVTVGNKTYTLDAPFFVLATQNPIEQEGTYPLPEAQMDRFMFNIWVDYPKADEEEAVVKATTVSRMQEPECVITKEQLLRLQEVVRKIPVSDHVVKYAVKLVRATRPSDPATPETIKQHVHCGAGPRAGQFLVLAAKARAVLDGRLHVACSDIRKSAVPVLRHRVMTNFAADAEGLSSMDLVKKLLELVPEPDEKAYG